MLMKKWDADIVNIENGVLASKKLELEQAVAAMADEINKLDIQNQTLTNELKTRSFYSHYMKSKEEISELKKKYSDLVDIKFEKVREEK